MLSMTKLVEHIESGPTESIFLTQKLIYTSHFLIKLARTCAGSKYLIFQSKFYASKISFICQKRIFYKKKLEQISWYLVKFLVQFYHWNTLSSKQNFKKILRPLHSPKSRLTITVPYQDLFTWPLTLVVKTEVMLLLYIVALKLRYLHWLSWSASVVMLRTLSQLRGRSLTT